MEEAIKAQAISNSSKFFNAIDNIDRYLYGRKMKNFILGSIFVLLVAPILDELLEVPYDRLTFLTTLLFFFYVLIIFLAWISAWRDDEGKWTAQRAVSRLTMYYKISKDTAAETRTNSKDELLYRSGRLLFIGAICWKASQNLSVFIRKPLENFFHKNMIRFRHFERFTNHYYWVALVLGLGIMIYLYRSNPKILERIKKDLRQLFSGRSYENYNNSAITIDVDKLVIHSSQDDHIKSVSAKNKSALFNDFVNAMQKWKPDNFHYEYEFQDDLYRHLKKNITDANIELEYPIGDKAHGNKGRADIVINDTILIEMKHNSNADAIQRAKGQIHQYSTIWNNRGPVILLLCNHDYEHAKLSYTSTMVDLTKLERPVLTIVAAN
jgi:hypothetical protein